MTVEERRHHETQSEAERHAEHQRIAHAAQERIHHLIDEHAAPEREPS